MFHPWEDGTSCESAQSRKGLCSPAGLRASSPETPAIQPRPLCAIREVTGGTMLRGLCGQPHGRATAPVPETLEERCAICSKGSRAFETQMLMC